MNMRTIAVVVFASLSLSASAQMSRGIEHTATGCVRAGELPLLQVSTAEKGELRAYFRRVNATDWCSIEGTNEGKLSRVILPKFESGDEIEYFLVIVRGTAVVARSPRIYRVRVSAACEAPSARHLVRFEPRCDDNDQALPAAVAGGYAVGPVVEPRSISPDSPQ
jgi:hypothetical protein